MGEAFGAITLVENDNNDEDFINPFIQEWFQGPKRRLWELMLY